MPMERSNLQPRLVAVYLAGRCCGSSSQSARVITVVKGAANTTNPNPPKSEVFTIPYSIDVNMGKHSGRSLQNADPYYFVSLTLFAIPAVISW
jgi:hypothetical protein